MTLWGDDGNYEDLIANEIGAYSGETSVMVGNDLKQVSPGIAWLNITRMATEPLRSPTSAEAPSTIFFFSFPLRQHNGL